MRPSTASGHRKKPRTHMPPHHRLPISLLPNRILWQASKCVLLVSALALAGCATSTGNQQAQSSSSRLIRDTYLSRTQSDPLANYLASREFIDRYTSYGSGSVNTDPSARAMANTALDFLGIKYKYGGNTPYTGFDCSGLVVYAAEKSLGLKLPRRSAEIARLGTSVQRSELKKGDLVFFNTRGHRNSHVGIYLGNQKFVHAPRTGAAVRVESMDVAYWRKRYNGARRLDIHTASTDTAALQLP